MGEVSAAALLPCDGEEGRGAGSTAAAARQDTRGYLRAVAVHFEGVDAGLVPALSLQEGAIFRQLQAGTAKIAPLKYFDPVMFAVLGTKGFKVNHNNNKKIQQIISLAFIRQRGRWKSALEGECDKRVNATSASTHRARTNWCHLPAHRATRRAARNPSSLHLPTAAVHLQTHRSGDAVSSGTRSPSPTCGSPHQPTNPPSQIQHQLQPQLSMHSRRKKNQIYIQSVKRH